MATNNEPDWRGRAGAKPRAGKKLGWKEEDPQGDGTEGKRRAKMIFLGLGGMAAVGGIIWLILLLTAGKRPGLITIAADPNYDADKGIARLDVPYDPYGWLSAQRLLKWAQGVARDDNTPKALGDKPFWLDDQIDDWADQVGKDSSIDPVIIYIGLHGGVDRAGDPILYVGRDPDRKAGLPVDADRPAVPLATVLDKLEERAAKKRKLLVLDVGRGLPDPNIGEVSADFSRAVKKKLAERIAKNPTLAVVLAADEGQRAWDSPDLGMTVLSYHLMKTLAEGAGNENMTAFRADELFESLHRQVEQWSKNNRPTPQAPQLIPPADEWNANETRKTQFAKQKFFKPGSGGASLDEISPPAPLPMNELKGEWQTATALANRRPTPATYTPAAWRRYRELLLRYEYATLAGEAVGARALKGAMDKARGDIERGLDLRLDATVYLQQLAVSAGRTPPATADGPTAAALADAAKQVKTALGDSPVPVDLHLPIMLHHYVKDVLQAEKDDPLRTTWKPAVQTRQLAEQAALGVRPGDPGLPYSERVWPDVSKTVQEGDAARRRGEDRMLGPADRAETATVEFNQAGAKYKAAFETAGQLQGPLRVRDRVLADLPFLARWLTETDDKGPGMAQANETLRALWAETLELADRLDRPFDPTALTNKATAVTAKFDELQKHVARVAKEAYTADSQTNWQAIEYVLRMPPPLLSAEDRGRLVQRSRQISQIFTKNETAVAGAPPAADEKIVRRAKAAAYSLGGEWTRWTQTQKDLGAVEATLEAKLKDLSERAAALGATLAAHRRRLGDFSRYPAGGSPEWAQAELFSRLAVSPGQMSGFEPAAVNAQARWKDMLEGQAARVALDHWYGPNGQPYFSTIVAPALLADADKIAQVLPEARRGKTEDAAKAARLALAKPLRLERIDGDTLIRWTTEADRTLRYRLEPMPYRTPDDGGKATAYEIPGEAVLLWQSTDPGLLTVDGPSRQLIDLSRPADGGFPVVVRAGPQIEAAAVVVKPATVVAGGYFRGQRGTLSQSTEVRINRRPDLVVSEVRPSRGAVLAVRADKNFDPGAVSILLDFSGSMGDPWKTPGQSKKKVIVDMLTGLLGDLPRGTELTTRVFHDNPDFTDRKSTLVYPGTFGRENFRDVLGGPNGIIDKITAIPAKGATPLVPTLRDAIADIPADYRGVKTVIVLTDGADTTHQPKVFTPKELAGGVVAAKDMTPDQRKALVKAVGKDLEALKRDDVAIHMVIFGTDAFEEALGEEMFKPVEQWETPGRVYRAADPVALRQELEAALRPKPRLLMKNGTAIPSDRGRPTYIPRSGLPTNRTEQTDGELRWWGFVQPDLYDLKYFRSKQAMSFTPGDAVCVRLDKAAGGQVRFRRELYYRDVVDLRKAGRADDANGDWYLSVPEVASRNANWNYLLTTAALEEKRGTEVDLTDDLRQIRPRFVWWELARAAGANGEKFPGTVMVHNLEGFPAPCWRVVGDHGAGAVEPRYLLRGWPTYGDAPLFTPQPVRVNVADLRAGVTRPAAAEVTVRVSLETVSFVPDPSVNPRLPADAAAGPQKCLVVRVNDPKGRRFQMRVPQLDVAVKEHRYFYDRDDPEPLRPNVAGYTAVFGPTSEDAIRQFPELEISLVSVTDVIAAGQPQLQIELRNPTNTERDLERIEPKLEPSAGSR
ncbi:vWA domain-containing protein [Limnoglobus roseus]|uniref:VWA domain-containing protein n=1 Tax=Limnoglobus roseus TaxID=2598579 RepID=A0A5C1A916_9BACT|nr:hypothetical protein [Limnoglobus roseus]QEL14292.1 VWA domain-containing protein [Limnoglobus roseus]